MGVLCAAYIVRYMWFIFWASVPQHSLQNASLFVRVDWGGGVAIMPVLSVQEAMSLLFWPLPVKEHTVELECRLVIKRLNEFSKSVDLNVA